jgi:exonuclease III
LLKGINIHFGKKFILVQSDAEFLAKCSLHNILKSRQCDILLNVHAPTEDKSNNVKDSFYEELECVFDKLPKYHMDIFLGDFNAKVGREDIFNLTTRNESLHKISNDNGVRSVNFATSKNLTVQSTIFLHRNIHKYTWMSPDGKTPSHIDHILVDKQRH